MTEAVLDDCEAVMTESRTDRDGMASSIRCSFEPATEDLRKSLEKSDLKLRRIEYGDWIDVEPNQK